MDQVAMLDREVERVHIDKVIEKCCKRLSEIHNNVVQSEAEDNMPNEDNGNNNMESNNTGDSSGASDASSVGSDVNVMELQWHRTAISG